jgi:CheY-like chemotaxis protein
MNRPLVLHLDDDENDTVLLQLAFSHVGLKNPLRAVKDGVEAIDYLAGRGPYADRARHPLPTLVLLDLKTPRRTGIEVLQWIRSQDEVARIVVIMLTASANQGDVDQAYRAGANAYLVKPSGFDELLTIVRLIADFWLNLNRFPSPPERPPAT